MFKKKIKDINTKYLKSIGIDVIEHLPHLEKPEFRNSKEISERMMVLMTLFQLHLEAPREIIEK